jgi:hypothetical protein
MIPDPLDLKALPSPTDGPDRKLTCIFRPGKCERQYRLDAFGTAGRFHRTQITESTIACTLSAVASVVSARKSTFVR